MMFKRLLLLSSVILIMILSGCENNEKGLEISDKSFTESDKKVIETYLNKNVMTDGYNITGNVYSAFDILGFNKEKEEIYIYAIIQEYVQSNGGIKEKSGWGCPFVLNMKKTGQTIEIIDHSFPRDGSLNSKDIKEMFPNKISNKIQSFGYVESKNISKRLEEKVKSAEGLEIIKDYVK